MTEEAINIPELSRDDVWWNTLRAVLTAVISSHTRISGDPHVRAAIDAAILTRAQLRHEPLDGYSSRQMCDALIVFWTAQRAKLP